MHLINTCPCPFLSSVPKTPVVPHNPVLPSLPQTGRAVPEKSEHSELFSQTASPARALKLLLGGLVSAETKSSKFNNENRMTQLRYTCPKLMHLRNSLDFERIYADGQRAGDDHLLIFACANDQNVNRLGLSVSRKHGSAVHRNVKRRRIREAFRCLQHDLPRSFDLIAVPRQRDDSTLQDYRNSLRTLIKKLSRRIASANESRRADNGAGADS